MKSTEITFTPTDGRGEELLDAMERETTSPFRWSLTTGARSYWVNGQGVPEGGLEPVLERLASNWREHLRLGR